MLEVVGIWNGINHLLKSRATSIAIYKMTEKMRKKYEKYWGEPNKFNILLLIVVALDPRYKMSYMNWAIDQLFNPKKTNDGSVLKSRLDTSLNLVFDEYKSQNGGAKMTHNKHMRRYPIISMIHMVGISFCKQQD